MENMDRNDLEAAKGHILNVTARRQVGDSIHHTLVLAIDQINDAIEELNQDSIGNLGSWRNDA